MTMLLRAVLILLLASAAQGAIAAERAIGAVDEAVVGRAIAYLNGVRSMTAKFVQRDQSGGVWTGRMWMQRPGNLRFQYDPPENDVIWSAGSFVNHFDAELETVTYVPRSMTPAWFLLDDKVRITDDVVVLAAAEVRGRYYVSAAQAGEATEGRVTLAFQSAPERILGWTIVDGVGGAMQVDLIDPDIGAEIPSEVFEYTPPVPESLK